MFQGFRDFVLRGNVVDLAVGVVIGAAFTGIVTAFSNGFINPLIKAITGGGAQVGGTFRVNGAVFDYGAFITAVLNFLIVAAILYFLVVLPVNRLNERLKRGQQAPVAEPSNQEKLLAEIRDELRRRP
ncbi:large conductance mechanosensitive channel protein MscL [Deinococcus sp. MIMF12]|uniref:Large-conductance mechanosensitive channel n=1 Tax=Deinococcus rhizophilus TaxID=3049544 RepID=A0ABT7JG54_9DEIO|nr:large conductance mechanosensitive channel protein MscL [Deinococcus rhizophilus]MDL2342923.1 large conductance mechanosensitive channel protein MscL [Deinococcus rhizophilus]